MAKPAPKKKKNKRPEGAIEATVNIRVNSDGAQVVYECGNPDCQAQLGETEDKDFKDGKFPIEATESEEEVTCEDCDTVNFCEGFAVAKV